MIRIVLAGILLVIFAVFITTLVTSNETGDPSKQNPSDAVDKPLVLVRSEDCAECHPEVYREWKESWHALAWTDPLVREKSDNFKQKDCIPCHAPRPIFERGIRPGERVVERIVHREDGVDCLSCHKLPQGGLASATEGITGPCMPVYYPAVREVALCSPCHNQHNTVEEWKITPPHLKKDGCGSCHMPVVDRNGKKGRDHRFLGGHSREMLLDAFTLVHDIEEGDGERRLVVRLKNDKTGHNFPTDSRHRALDLIVTFFKEGGLAFPAVDGEDREFGQEPGTYRLRCRNPYRSETGKIDTQIRAGEEAVLEAPVPDDAVRALIQVVYKLTPFQTDEESELLAKEEVTL